MTYKESLFSFFIRNSQELLRYTIHILGIAFLTSSYYDFLRIYFSIGSVIGLDGTPWRKVLKLLQTQIILQYSIKVIVIFARRTNSRSSFSHINKTVCDIRLYVYDANKLIGIRKFHDHHFLSSIVYVHAIFYVYFSCLSKWKPK